MASLSDRINTSEDLVKKAKGLQDSSKDQLIISLCSGTGCKAAGSDYIYDILKKEVKKFQPNIDKEIIIRRTGCHGFCEKGPLIIFYPQEICYLGVTEEDIPLVVSETLKGNLIEKLLYKTDESKLVLKEFDIPFYKYQRRIILGNNSKIDSKSIEDYILFGGYRALSKALTEMNPEEVLSEVKNQD